MDIKLKKRPWYIRYRYYILTATAFLALFIYAISLSLGPRRMSVSDDEVTIADVESGKFLEYVDVEGIVQPILTLKVNTMESGFVDRIVAEEGAMLHKGDTILVLKNPELLRAIDDEQDEWERQQRTYREQDITMKQKTIDLKQQALDAEYEMNALDRKLEIAREEYRMGVKSKAELEVSEEEYRHKLQTTKYKLQTLKLDSASNVLRQELLRGDIERANKMRNRTNERMSGLVVTAPIDGQLSYLAVTPGQQVAMGMSICEIKDLSNYKICAKLNEYYIDRISTGLPASVSYQRKDFSLRVSKVVPEVKDRNFLIELTALQSNSMSPSPCGEGWDGVFRIGKSFRVKIELGKPESALVIPRGDFYNTTNGQWIYRLSEDGGTATKVQITIGRQNPRQYEITSGLKAGDRVIVSGYGKFNDAEMIAFAKKIAK